MKRKMTPKQKFWFVMFCLSVISILIGCINLSTWGTNEQWGLLSITILIPFFIICRSTHELK